MLKRALSHLARSALRQLSGQLGNNATQQARLAQLIVDIQRSAPDDAERLLEALKNGLQSQTDEFGRYSAAETLSTAVYPKYKFSEFARTFLEDDSFIAYYERFMDPGNWHSLDRKYTLNELLKQVRHVPGDIAECGAYKGASAFLMCQFLAGSRAQVHLFDSFEGLAEPQHIDGSYWKRGSLCSGEDALKSTLAGFSNFQVYKGWIPERFSEVADLTFRFVHIDVDLYEPTRDSLAFFYPKLAPGGILLLDDHGFSSCPGATKAANDYFSDRPEQQLSLLPTGQAFSVKR